MLPSWLDYSLSENTAVAMFRGLRGLSASWGELIAAAQATIGVYQELPRESVEELYEEEAVLPIIAASRILDAASQPPSGLPHEDALYLGLTAATSFAMCGNFPSATAVIRRIFPRFAFSSIEYAAVAATVAPNLLPRILGNYTEISPVRAYLELLEYFLQSGDASKMDDLRSRLVDCMLAVDSSFEGSLLRSCRLALEHIFTLSTPRVLRGIEVLNDEDYIQRLVDQGVRVLLPPQFKALAKRRLATMTENAIVALPTSTGKTLLGEACLFSALRDGPGIVCYVAPYVALGSQVARSLREHLPDSFRVHPMIGGFREVEALDPVSNKEVIVATPERLDALMRLSPHLSSFLRCVVCDEAHIVQNGIRGLRLEGVLTRLRMLQDRGESIRLVLLSAVLSSYSRLSRWIGASDDSILVDSWKPTARRLAFWKQTGRLTWYIGDDPIRRQGSTNESTIGEIDLPWPETSFYPTRNPGQVRQQQPLVNDNIAYLADLLSGRYSGLILCVCGTKAGTRQLAAVLAQRLVPLEPVPGVIGSIIARIQASHRFLLPMCELLLRGVAFHNSTIPFEIRRLIEDAAQADELKIIVSTTTLAEGVDLPFRFTIIVDWLTWQGSQQRPMDPLLFRNVAGRCGRAGTYTEGDTIIFDNPLGEPSFTYPYPSRDRFQRQVFLANTATEVTSAFTHDYANADESEGLVAVIASHFLAAIPENPDCDDLADQFARFSLSAQQDSGEARLRKVLKSTEESLLDETRGALAIAASPLRLTALGSAANATGFSPNSSRQIAEFLGRDVTYDELPALASDLLRALGTLPEQTNNGLRKVLATTRSKFPVKPSDFPQVVSAWLAGEARENIFGALPFTQRSSLRPGIQDWLRGVEAPKWDEVFDKFVEFSKAVLEEYLPWLMWASSGLSTFVSGWSEEVPWNLWIQMMQLGVDSMWAVNAVRTGAPASRKVISVVGRNWPFQFVAEDDPLGLSVVRNLNTRDRVEEFFRRAVLEAGGRNTSEGKDVIRLWSWLWDRAGLNPDEVRTSSESES